MKKALIFVLVLVLVASCALLIACNNVTEIKFKEDTVPPQVIRTKTIDYSKIRIIVTMENGDETELSLTDKNVSYTPIDVSTTGTKQLTASYGGKKAEAFITVVEGDIDDYIVTGFENSDGYNAYLEAKEKKTNKEAEFVDRNAPYIVGSDNGYVFIPKTTAVLGTDIVTNAQVKTTYKLYIKNGGSYSELTGTDKDEYLTSAENNIYYFTDQANGKAFKLEVTLADTYDTILDVSKKTVEHEFEVTEGYNVYDAWGMAVMDTLNVKSWAAIKQMKLAWDNGKAISEFTNVSKVILHNNITVKKDNLPTNYFWTENEEALTNGKSYQDAYGRAPEKLKNLLTGSLKEVYLGEAWEENGNWNRNQRGLYVNEGISLYGNYLTLSYDAGYTVDGNNNVTAPNGGIYVVYDYQQENRSNVTYPEPHWNLIAYRSKTEGSENNVASIENVYFVGQTQKTENTKLPGGLGMVFSELQELTINNVIGNQWYFNVHISENDASVTMDGSKFYDSFSHMVFGWYANELHVTNSTFKRAGGPLFILQSPSYVSGSSGELQNDRHNALNFTIDSTNDLENWLSGAEAWFEINLDVKSRAAVQQMLGLNTVLDKDLNKNYCKMENGIPKYNMLMILIPFTDDVFDNQHHLAGSITIGDDVYSMNDPVLNIRDTAQKLADLVDGLKTNFASELEESHIAALDKLKTGALNNIVNNNALLPLTLAPLYKSGNNYAYNNTENMFIMPAVVQGLAQLSDGAELAVSILQGKLNEVKTVISQAEAEGGDASQQKQMAAVLQTTIEKWQSWIESVKPLADLNADTDEQISANWAQGWANSEDYAALWVNPGGLGDPDFTLNYFMIMFAENPAATPAA